MELLYFVSVSKYKTETSRRQITWKIKDNAKIPRQSLKLFGWYFFPWLLSSLIDLGLFIGSVHGVGKC